jgi:transcriptional regulator with XRE-family HTH domain
MDGLWTLRHGTYWLWVVMANQPISPAAGTFGERVRSRRHQLGQSQEQLAAECGLHWTYIGQVERGQRNISLHNILKIAGGLRIDPGELVRGLRVPEE